MTELNRREFAVGAALLPIVAVVAHAQVLPIMKVSKDPNCGCCDGWVAHLRANGFSVDVTETADMDRIKTSLGVPEPLRSCHTGEIAGYVVEGHVPVAAIQRLLAERPSVIGLAVPGMPASSPGMDVPGAADVYDVMLFSPSVQKRYARYRGLREVPN